MPSAAHPIRLVTIAATDTVRAAIWIHAFLIGGLPLVMWTNKELARREPTGILWVSVTSERVSHIEGEAATARRIAAFVDVVTGASGGDPVRAGS
jgi:hypothetical protein